jgi:lipoate-protein ligase B
VYVNDTLMLTHKNESFTEEAFYTLDEKKIITKKIDDLGTNLKKDVFMIIHFVQLNISVETADFSHIKASGFEEASARLIKWLISENVMNSSGVINPAQLRNFDRKYNQHNSMRKKKAANKKTSDS